MRWPSSFGRDSMDLPTTQLWKPIQFVFTLKCAFSYLSFKKWKCYICHDQLNKQRCLTLMFINPTIVEI
jgi:hypothetical protein